MQLKSLGLDGLPYLDAKTYKGWRDNGFQVQKGEKSQITGLTWISVNKNHDNEDTEDDRVYRMPKAYNLFHRSQVAAL